ncbi:hypothetical protein OG799_14220 [Micromonospora sp. NBC_00898]|uniref:hypothetical protein n=1 Tax=Micromonospora sp. NBC_00898 TaxID=2975981 RepID=UPI00386A63EF|nr:hypothetical protein OG799_14220 [Micromonospora sp. NBC_00898]
MKSVVAGNEVEQLRLGLGQVLEYRYRLAAHGVSATPVLLTQCTDPAWLAICADSGVLLLAGDEEPTWAPRLTSAVVQPTAGTVFPADLSRT